MRSMVGGSRGQHVRAIPQGHSGEGRNPSLMLSTPLDGRVGLEGWTPASAGVTPCVGLLSILTPLTACRPCESRDPTIRRLEQRNGFPLSRE